MDAVPYGHTTHTTVLCCVWGVMCDVVSTHTRAQTRNIMHTVKATILIAHHATRKHAARRPRHGGPQHQPLRFAHGPSARRASLSAAALPRRGGPPTVRRPRSARWRSARQPRCGGPRYGGPPSEHSGPAWQCTQSQNGLVCPSGAGGRGGMGQVRIGGAPVEAAAASGG